MPKKIRFPLKLAEGVEVRTLEELREHFALAPILAHYKSGRLLTWLEDRYLEGEAEAVRALDEFAPDFQRRLCEVFQVEYAGEEVDMEEIERRQERMKRLRAVTDEAEFIENIDHVAFAQEELADLLDEGESVIYLCGEHFTVPAFRKGVAYIGTKDPVVHISGKLPETLEEMGITFRGCKVDNLPTSAVVMEEPSANQNALDRRLAELFTRLRYTQCIAITENFLVFQRHYGPMDKKLFRLDLRTLDKAEVPESLDVPYSTWGPGFIGDELIYHNFQERRVVSIDISSLKESTLMKTMDLYDTTAEYILAADGSDGARLLNRKTGKTTYFEKRYEKILGNRLYTIRKSYNYAYDLTTGKERQIRKFSWDFEPCRECGDYLYGIVRGACSERELFVYNQSTKKMTSLLTYDDAGLMASGNIYQNFWILIDRESMDEPITVYAVDVETAEVHELTHVEESNGVTILGIIGSAFYYTICDEVEDEDDHDEDDEDEDEAGEDQEKNEKVSPYHLFKIDLNTLGEAVEIN